MAKARAERKANRTELINHYKNLILGDMLSASVEEYSCEDELCVAMTRAGKGRVRSLIEARPEAKSLVTVALNELKKEYRVDR